MTWEIREGDCLDQLRELADEADLTPDHIEALRACGVTDAGKAQHTQDGFGKNTKEAQRLAAEAKEVLGGYHREFLLARPSRGAAEQTCDCGPMAPLGEPTVLDPFAGAGTTGLVATQHGRDFIGIELNPEYAEMARERIRRWEANPAGALEGDPDPIPGQESLLEEAA